MSPYISVDEAAKHLNISKQRIRTLCRNYELNAKKIGNSWIIDEESVYQYGLKTAHVIAEDHPAYVVNSRKNQEPTVLSFFSGIMGLDLGLEKAGFEIKLACENDKYCRQTITLNRPNMALIGDINQYTAKEILKFAGLTKKDEVDLMIGGPPCQAFSTAGNRKGFNDDRGNVFLKFLDIALEIRPKFIVIENVRGLLSCPMSHRPHDKRGIEYPDLSLDELPGGALNFILNRLKKAKYGYSFNLYNSANFGTPQIRERVIIICSRNGQMPPYLIPTHSQNGEFGLPKWKTFKQAVKGIKNHHHVNFPDTRLKYYKLLKEGQNWKNLPAKLQKEALGNSYYAGGGKTGFLRRLAWNKPSPTLVTHPAMPATDLAHPVENRPLSIEEYNRIQEIPDDWVLAGSLIEQYKQVGNAVPLGLGYALGTLIRKLLDEVAVINYQGFNYSRYKNTNEYEWENEFMKIRDKKTQVNKQAELNFG